MRTLIDLPDNQIQALAELCERVRQPRAAVIREAVAEYLERRLKKPVDAAYGLWGAGAMDGVAYQEKARAEW
jgi:predicted transcriptional regulator